MNPSGGFSGATQARSARGQTVGDGELRRDDRQRSHVREELRQAPRWAQPLEGGRHRPASSLVCSRIVETRLMLGPGADNPFPVDGRGAQG